VKKVLLMLLMPVVVTISTGLASYVSAGVATKHSSQFCTSIKPSVKASQQLKPILATMNDDDLAKTRTQLLTQVNTLLNTFRSVKVQMRSASAIVRASFNWDVLSAGSFKAELEKANTKAQFRTAVGNVVGAHPEEDPFINYIHSHCENSAP
jgi:hypothetical protein